MARKSIRSYGLAVIASQAIWALPGAQPASAQVAVPCTAPAFTGLISPDVPHDVTAGPSASVAELACFAWQEFIALNWIAMDPASTGMRGRADTTAPFLIGPSDQDSQGNFPLVVWQTYRHKNELFPADGNTDSSFDSSQPTYVYSTPPTAGSVVAPLTGQPSFNLFNNLDETSEIGLCNMYSHADPTTEPETGIRIGYEAKVSRAVFDYANQSGFTQPGPTKQYLTLQNALAANQGNLAAYGGICSIPPGTTQQIVMLPCGDNSVTGDAGEGAIEIKAAWRQLTDAEVSGGRFFMRKVLYYTGPQGNQTYNNAVWGLVSLHIIHKTKSFPAFVFATWEQVDNYDDTATPPANSQNLAFENTGTPLPIIPVTRVHPIHSQVAATNDAVHTAFMTGNADTVWQYYELIGVQATPVNGPPPATASSDDLSYYYLANIMVETNQTLQNFFGAAPGGTVIPFQNVALGGQTYQMGGCQGCHGFQGQYIGGDMSRLLAVGAPNAAQPDSLDSSTLASVRAYQKRTTAVTLRQFRPQPGLWGKDRSDYREEFREDQRATGNQ